MSKYLNTRLVAAITAQAVGAVYVDRQVTNIADPVDFPKTLANGDQVQIGVVPAGHVLIPRLSAIKVPVFDTNGVPTGKANVGTSDDPDKFAAALNLGQANDVALLGTFDTVGNPEQDTPIFLTLAAALATKATTGKVTLDLALRAWNPDVDVAVTEI